jgi:hypothetical protein
MVETAHQEDRGKMRTWWPLLVLGRLMGVGPTNFANGRLTRSVGANSTTVEPHTQPRSLQFDVRIGDRYDADRFGINSDSAAEEL